MASTGDTIEDPAHVAPTHPASASGSVDCSNARAYAARAAMGSLFEIFLYGEEPERLEGAANEALDEIVRLDAQLSHYRDDSDIARLNASAASGWVRVEPCLYGLLERCAVVSRATGGAFDITAGPLVKAWGFHEGTGHLPAEG